MTKKRPKMDNTNWRGGGPCFQMKNVNFRRAAQKGEPAGCTKRCSSGLRKRAGRAAEKGRPLARPFPQPNLLCSPP